MALTIRSHRHRARTSPRRGTRDNLPIARLKPAVAEPSETGWKDTVIAYPAEVTRVRIKFEMPGRYVWHCHIVEHEDNEMMRPYRIGPAEPGQPASATVGQAADPRMTDSPGQYER